jgi:hypothetical protein
VPGVDSRKVDRHGRLQSRLGSNRIPSRAEEVVLVRGYASARETIRKAKRAEKGASASLRSRINRSVTLHRTYIAQDYLPVAGSCVLARTILDHRRVSRRAGQGVPRCTHDYARFRGVDGVHETVRSPVLSRGPCACTGFGCERPRPRRNITGRARPRVFNSHASACGAVRLRNDELPEQPLSRAEPSTACNRPR